MSKITDRNRPMKYDDLTEGEKKAAVQHIGGPEAVLRLNRRELRVTEWPAPWRHVEDNVLAYRVWGTDIPSTGWFQTLESFAGLKVNTPSAFVLLNHRGPHQISGSNQYLDLMVLRSSFFKDHERTFANAMAEGKRRGWLPATVESAYSSAEMLGCDQMRAMGVGSLLFMHEPTVLAEGIGIPAGPYNLSLLNDFQRRDRYFHAGIYEGDVLAHTDFVFLSPSN